MAGLELVRAVAGGGFRDKGADNINGLTSCCGPTLLGPLLRMQELYTNTLCLESACLFSDGLPHFKMS